MLYAIDAKGKGRNSAIIGNMSANRSRGTATSAMTKFAHLVAAQLGKAAAGGAFDRAVLIAPVHVRNDIEAALDTRTAAMVTGKSVKDPVRIPDYALSSHLTEWVGPPQRRM